LIYKNKNKKHKIFNAEVSDSNDDDFFSEFKDEKKVSDEIVILFKKTVNKMFKFKWVETLNFSHI